MIIAVCGSRKFKDYETVKAVLNQYVPNVTKIITGGAQGADQLAKRYAKENGLALEIIRPDYEKHLARVAPLMRNTIIVEKSQQVVAFYYDKKQGGTLDTVRKAIKAGKVVIEVLSGKIEKYDSGSLF